ncbi:MFS siderochrome iron transporter 1 [Sporothrix bragantina]|uniref:MFS siderochrome iron transporter 1 n=1 Tax=Sporothrix bragantina TaxID=671064 RepID=A0ABP0BUV5_9PEZI
MASTAKPVQSPSTASSMTAGRVPASDAPQPDLEAGNAVKSAPAPAASSTPSKISHWQLVFNQGYLTPEVIAAQYPGEGTEESPYVVSFLPTDPRDPQQFKTWQKWLYTLIMAFATLGIAFVSTAYTGGLSEIVATFHVSTEVSILGISLFVLGFAIGPLLWAPSSEFFGRQILFVTTYTVLTLFNVGAAVAQNIQTLIIVRFFAGAFGSSPLTNAGGVIADMFSASERGLATAVFAAAPFLGPSLGPIVAGFLGDAAGWRWVEGLMAIFTGVMVAVGGLVVPETYAPVLLRKRAAALSKKTGKVYVSKLDMHHRSAGAKGPSMGAQFRTALSRPWILLFREPIVMVLSIYMAIIYGTMYMMFAAFPIIFQEGRGWSAGIGGLAFLGIAVGMTAAVSYAMFDNRRYAAKAASSPDGMAPPEARLPLGIIGSILLPVGLFWFAWTNAAPVHWIVPIIGSGFFAAGLVLVFLSLLNYLIDSYVIFAASVLAASTVIRSLFGAAFPLFTTYMYANLGVHWASSIPAFLALGCVPFPFLFLKYGKTIRMRCKYAAEAAEVLQRMRASQLQAQRQVQEAQQQGSNNNNNNDDMDEDDYMAEADEREAEQRFEHDLEKKATRTEGQSVPLGAAGSGSQNVSDDEKAANKV